MEVQAPQDSALTFEKVWAMFQETDRKFREDREEAQKQREDADRKFREDRKEADRKFEEYRKENQKILGDLGRKFGSVVEHLFLPNLHKKFHQFGYTFGKSSGNVLIQDRVNKIYAQIDIFLENGDCAMAVEVKAQPNNNDILEHIERMEKLRQWADLHQDKRKLYGAIAGAIIPDNVRDYALKQGFYVIEQSDTLVNILGPEGGEAKAW
jgi:Holliday junction resolvase-like predicted endonuclease